MKHIYSIYATHIYTLRERTGSRMVAFDLDKICLEKQGKMLCTVTRLFDAIANITEEGLPSANWTVHEDDPQKVTETETQFVEVWTEIKHCVETHLDETSLDESPDQNPFATVSIDGRPPANQAMTVSLRHERSGQIKIGIDEP